MEILIQILTPVATALGGWLMGRRKQNNDFLGELQASINLLSAENKKLMEEVVHLRRENARMSVNQELLMGQLSALREESETMKQLLGKMNIAVPRGRVRIKGQEV